MTGRELFAKYSYIIDILSKLTAKLPKRYRSYRLDKLRNKSGSIPMMKRYLLVRTLTKKCGKNVAIFPEVFFENIENLEIGDNVSIHQMCYIDAEGGIIIEDNVSIAHRCSVLSSNHGFDAEDTPIKYQKMSLKKTTIQENVWIGCGSVILAGSCIGNGTVIGANSTVTNSIPSNSVAFGTPCRVYKKRVEDL